jgi:NADP-dependent 3-hydroxy acid dehydrogenase YdfG
MNAGTAPLAGHAVLVTGAARRVGAVIAAAFHAAGARVAIHYRSSGADADALIGRLNGDRADSARAFRADLADAAACDTLVTEVVRAFGRLDVLVNNAGVMPLSPMSALKVDEWDRMIDVNIKGVLNGVAAALPRFEAQGSGHFVNVASVAGFVVFPSSAVYSATKFAVRALSEGLRQELKTVRVTTISPGAIATELGHDITDSATRDVLSGFRSIALKPDAIARAIAYAVSQPADVDVNEVIVRPVAQPL